MLTIGLTGGIATGKSLVSEILEKCGASLINADLLGHESYLPGTEGFHQVVFRFGSEVVGRDGTIDRKALGKLVFSDSENMSDLNAILHPIIFELIKKKLENNLNNNVGVTVVEAAILIEAGWQELFDEIWVVSSNQNVVIKRLQSRNGLDVKQAMSRINSQMPQKERIQHADRIIDNSGTVEQLRCRVNKICLEKSKS